MNGKRQLPPLANWRVDSLRFTALYKPLQLSTAGGLWRELVGSDPDEQRTQPKMSQVYEEGPWEAGTLICTGMTGRKDLQYASIPTPEVFGSIGDLSVGLPPFRALVKKFFDLMGEPHRIAFGVVVNQQVEDRHAAYKLLGEYLPAVQIDPTGSRDFLYRINRPREFSLGQTRMTINRLSSWAAIVQSRLSFVLSPEKQEIAKSNTQPLHGIHAELDLSTDDSFEGKINANQASEIFGYFVGCATEVSEMGDIP